MKKMIESMIIAGCMLVALLYMTACSDKLDVQQMYEFDLATLPVQTTIIKGEEAEIRCQLVRSGEYQDTKYFIRYFQPTGKGELRMENGTVLLPNDLYPLPEETFRLYYRSFGTDQQKIDIYILDSFGQVVQKSFAFNNEAEDEKEDTE
ncbi:DUF3872 domain-containing protein [Bacteroides fragilis]|uniref:DUF3872 domain-containing protein n=2 Tax=Bacteroides fragilis TaxID=817 RepID=A0AAP9NC42_BACFG|nr:DUF3872 domain-containing protein [Bacteroides fragilis]EFR52628.1 conjugative transposon protein TraQ family protein [Bacteroides fragilis 3_1_12]MBM6510979.1 DUF3872 domain-containing protein [Bacteroides fragilis]QKH83988.1 DUF3872 domain-containing protein [Bacteroides fragilis]